MPAKKRSRSGYRPSGKRPRHAGGYQRRDPSNFGKTPPRQDDPEGEIEVEGTIVQVLAGTMFRVELAVNNQVVLAHISGKMRRRFIRLVVGDRVKMEMSPYDMSKARITFRL